MNHKLIHEIARKSYTPDELKDHPFNGSTCQLYLGQNKYQEIYDRETKTNYSTHRAVCTFYHGEAPSPTHQVNHLCCNVGCVNPDHLEWVTPKENIRYSYTNGKRKLKISRADVEAIRSSTKRNVDLAKLYKVTPAYISYIRNYHRRNQEW